MANVFLILIILVLVFFIAQKYVIKKDDTKDYQYKIRGPVLTPNESAFYQALISAVGQHGIVLANVTMDKVIKPKDIKSKKDLYIASGKITRNYFQYLICDARTYEPRAVVELNDGRALDKGKADREKLLIHVCKTANIPLIGGNIKYSYQVGKLRRLLAAHIDLIEPDKEVRFCKKCGSPMVVKVATMGEFKGRRFFTCSRQPHCTYTENYNVVYEDDEEYDS
ncbi:DUF2726 domain-containing protein [Vibrio sp.]|uniref:DUF2726 domain-containing protein n=1 Tax=Vibrio viridaestus TaxID=2487322 RepID=A0A3N9TAC6_9VIBR|nr:DUF2726 domain-containing protein [Vibrio viridaestus]MDC0611634.1 DUF2726 domain-containing protein [Vibrio sp.]RQW61051.1 DUF2726 domain-containing protein [Vibrio viridaestus]